MLGKKAINNVDLFQIIGEIEEWKLLNITLQELKTIALKKIIDGYFLAAKFYCWNLDVL